MRTRAFEFLFLSWALGTIAVHFNYEQDVVAFEHVQRAAQFRAIRHAIRSVDPAKLYAPTFAAPFDALIVPSDETLDDLERRLRDMYIHELRKRGKVWEA